MTAINSGDFQEFKFHDQPPHVSSLRGFLDMVKHHRGAAEAEQRLILLYHKRLDIPEQEVSQAGQERPLSPALLVSFQDHLHKMGSVLTTLSYKVTSHTALASTLMTSLYSNHHCRGPLFQIYSQSEVLGCKTLARAFDRET